MRRHLRKSTSDSPLLAGSGPMVMTLLAASVCIGLVGTPAGAQLESVDPSDPERESIFDPAPARGAQIAMVDPGVSDSIVRLYGAVFDRDPDDEGESFWVDRYVAGERLESVARRFMGSPEWIDLYGEVDDAGFTELLYQNVLERSPDEEGAAYWVDRLEGGLRRSSMLLGFSESPEFVAATNTAPPVAPPPLFPALPAGSGTGRRIVYSGSQQRAWLVDGDEITVDSYVVSGRWGTPTPGTYSVYSKSPKAWAGHDGITMNHMVRFARGKRLAIGFHSIPLYADGTPMQTEAELGSYRSGGCVRQANHKAEALYAWAAVGTTVVVTP